MLSANVFHELQPIVGGRNVRCAGCAQAKAFKPINTDRIRFLFFFIVYSFDDFGSVRKYITF